MSVPWPKYKLREVAEVRASNVDKKTHSSELPVKLCNYMDVYSNEYITGGIDFMEASATPAEIARFGVKSGDVIITKDSESPYDIGVPTVISEEICDLVCGYHLALIRPDTEFLNPVFLAKHLSSYPITRYFSLQASGSTRYGLPISAIELVEIPIPPKIEQNKIAEIFTKLDLAIEQTKELIAKQQRIKSGLMHDLLTCGIDEHGILRSAETHEFKDTPLGRIPVEWEVSELGNCAFVTKLAGFEYTNYFDYRTGGDIIALRALNIKNERLDLEDIQRIPIAVSDKLPRSKIYADNILMTYIGAYIGDVVRIKESNKYHLAPNIAKIVAGKSLVACFLEVYLRSNWVQRQIKNLTAVTATPSLTMTQIRKLLVAIPKDGNEQIKISSRISGLTNYLDSVESELKKLHSLKTALMQDLLTGKVRVTPLLEEK